jgi:hypothetical protein
MGWNNEKTMSSNAVKTISAEWLNRRCGMKWKTHAGVGFLALALAAIPFGDPTVGAAGQDQQVQSGEVGAATLFAYSGGFVRGKLARTQDAPQTFGETAPAWVNVAGATLTRVVASGTSDLFNVAFSAEGRLFRGGGDDWVAIRVLDNGIPLEPYDTTSEQAFFSADGYATHKGNWVRRVGGGTHTLQVQVRIFDGAPLEVLSGWIDDWTFELVIYD